MDAYIYDADIFCEDCAASIRGVLDADGVTNTGDPDDYPQGAGGEADCPQHCGQCHVFLENPLTPDGYKYVRKALLNFHGNHDIVAMWADYYDIENNAR